MLNTPQVASGSIFTIHYETLKYVLQEYLLELGVQIRYNTMAAAAIVEENVVRGVITEFQKYKK